MLKQALISLSIFRSLAEGALWTRLNSTSSKSSRYSGHLKAITILRHLPRHRHRPFRLPVKPNELTALQLLYRKKKKKRRIRSSSRHNKEARRESGRHPKGNSIPQCIVSSQSDRRDSIPRSWLQYSISLPPHESSRRASCTYPSLQITAPMTHTRETLRRSQRLEKKIKSKETERITPTAHAR